MPCSRVPAKAWVVALACLLAGCLYIPTPGGKALEGREVNAEDLAFLQSGKTTKEDVTGKLGEPTILWRDENILIYRWVKLRGVLLWAVAGGYSVIGGAVDVPQEFAFLVEFDRDNRFVRSETLERPPTKSYGDFLLDWRNAQRARDWQSQPKEP